MQDLGTKIYSDDPNLPYKTTKLNALYSRMEIDGVLAKWGVKKSGWSWEPEINQIYITFEYEETIEGQTVHPVIRVEAPVIWNHKTKKGAEEVNWNISLRVMYWFIKTHLEAAYLWQAAKLLLFCLTLPLAENCMKLWPIKCWAILIRFRLCPPLSSSQITIK